MKDKIKKIINLISHWKIILIIILIGAGLFYWFEIRPTRIVNFCSEEAMTKAIIKNHKWQIGGIMEKYSIDSKEEAIAYLDNPLYQSSVYNHYYLICLREKGINQ